MRPIVLAVVLTVAVLMPKMGNAQVEYAEWQFNGEPMPFAGLTYVPTRGTRFFDAQLMAEIGRYRGVPVYADVTLEPYSIVYVRIGRNLVRAYERRRDRELAGTEGSRPSAFPLVSPSEALREPAVGTAGVVVPIAAREALAPAATTTSIGRPRTESIMRPVGMNGVWIEFNGSRWYSDGVARMVTADRFTRIGEYRGFPVYREKAGGDDRIWVTTMLNGPVAPFQRR